MGWSDSYFQFARLPSWRRSELSQEFAPLRANEQCFIRKNHTCGKLYGASKSCFVACPDEEDLEPILALLYEKLAKVGVETIIAVKERAYGQDIFCTKICGKIIESKFCVVILDDSVANGKNIPNPNVYYEYGLMTAMEKHIIPLQKDGLDLAFNIQSYDTIKYSQRNIATELDRAIKDANRLTGPKERPETKSIASTRSILRRLELSGFEAKGDSWAFSDVIVDTDFKGFTYDSDKFFVYLGKVDEHREFQTYLEDLGVVLFRTEKHIVKQEEDLDGIRKQLEGLEDGKDVVIRLGGKRLRPSRVIPEEKAKRMEELLLACAQMFVGFVIHPKLDASNFLEKAKSIIQEYPRFVLASSSEGEIAFGDVIVTLSSQP